MRWENIIIHHSLTKDSDTVSWQAIRKYHIETMGFKSTGYHYGIELINDEYEIIVGRLLDEQGAHTKGKNHDSIGICIVGNFDLAPPNERQWELTTKLCVSLARVFNIRLSNIYGHRDFANYKTCPGVMFNMEKLRDDVAKSIIGNVKRYET